MRSDAFIDLNPFGGIRRRSELLDWVGARGYQLRSTKHDIEYIVLLEREIARFAHVLAWRGDVSARFSGSRGAKSFSKCVNFHESGKKIPASHNG